MATCASRRETLPSIGITHIIEHPSLVDLLLKLSQEMHSEEYILLLIDIHDYCNSDACHRAEKASFIYETYISPTSPMDVGASQQTIRNIERRMCEEKVEPGADIFLDLECEVIRCTEDILTKFKLQHGATCVEIINQQIVFN
ncbi:regulator of G-protein signaling [Acrasis kona]|uniref:Regulator of G-protein signaling n=1 Tax=Acrasis kona TaxID=1008807 RepID=A0AAW2Z1G3_9EUKA